MQFIYCKLHRSADAVQHYYVLSSVDENSAICSALTVYLQCFVLYFITNSGLISPCFALYPYEKHGLTKPEKLIVYVHCRKCIATHEMYAVKPLYFIYTIKDVLISIPKSDPQHNALQWRVQFIQENYVTNVQ